MTPVIARLVRGVIVLCCLLGSISYAAGSTSTSFRTGLFVDTKGLTQDLYESVHTQDGGVLAQHRRITHRTTYLTIPLDAMLWLGSTRICPFLKAGPETSVLLSMRARATDETGHVVNIDRESRSQFDDVVVGLRLACGLCTTSSRYPVYIEGGFRFGLLGDPDTRSFSTNIGVII